MVGIVPVGILLGMRRQNATSYMRQREECISLEHGAQLLLAVLLTISCLWPLGGGHQMAQTQPTRTARTIVEAVPAALEKHDPFLGVGLLAQIEARVGAVVAGDARVG